MGNTKIIFNNKNMKKFIYCLYAIAIICICFAVTREKVLAAENDVVYIPDECFKATLNKALGEEDASKDITEAQLSKITSLKIYIDESGVTDITGISYCTGLRELYIYSKYQGEMVIGKKITDELKKLNSISYFRMRYIKCEDYSFMESFSNITKIYMSNCDISVVPNLVKCTNLQSLCFQECEQLVDIWSLTGMTNLTLLDVEDVVITEINKDKYMNTISSLYNLEELAMTHCNITDEHIGMFENLNKLKCLKLGANDITDIEFLLKCKNTLERLSLYATNIDNDDLKVIEQLTNLTVLELSATRITDYSFINKLPKLTNDCIRIETWEEDSPNKSYVETYIPCFELASSYVIKNNVKNENGNYVAPIESELYQYNEQTQEIVIFGEKLRTLNSLDINYKFVAENALGDNFYIEHKQTVEFIILEECSDILSCLENDISLGVNVDSKYSEYLECQWYKDGKKIEGATSLVLDIKDSKLSDGGKYKVVVSLGDYSATSKEILLTVKNYKNMSVKLNVDTSYSDGNFYRGDLAIYSVEVEGGSGEYTYSFWYKPAGCNVFQGPGWQESSTYMHILLIAGVMKVYAKVEDSDGNIAISDVVVLNVNEKIKGNLTIEGSSEKTNVLVEDSVQLNIESTGGVGDHTYKFEVKNLDTGKIKTIRDYSSGTSMIVKIMQESRLEYTVYVKDSCGREVASNTVRVNAYDKFLSAEFFINGMSNNAEAILGEDVTLEIKTQGGSGQYKYDYIIYDAVTKEIVRAKTNSRDKSVLTWKPKANGTYLVSMVARDTDGNFVLPEGIESFEEISEKLLNLKVVREPGLYKASDGKWYYYVKDQIDETYTGLAKNDYGWWYVKEGKLDLTYTGLAKNEHGWWHVTNGKLDLTYTGISSNLYGNWYVKNGKLDLTYTGMVTDKYGTWYMESGKVASKLSGLVKTTAGWLYLTKGKLETNYTGLAKNEYGYWYVKNGKLDLTYTGLAKNEYGWWHVTKGKLDLTYTGISTNQYGQWYVKNGRLQATYTGTLKLNGVTYNIVKGKVV